MSPKLGLSPPSYGYSTQCTRQRPDTDLARESASYFALGVFDHRCKLGDARVQRGEYPSNRPPVRPALPALQPPDERGVDFQAPRKLLLREPGLVPQRAKRPAENDLILLNGELAAALHAQKRRRAPLSAPG